MKKFIVAILVLVVGVFVVFKFKPHQTPDSDSLRHLTTGDVIGYADKNDTYAWLGIPFAQAPLGELRWRAPQPPQAWNGVRKALDFSAICPQLPPFSLSSNSAPVGDEDCLYLNVWAPRITQAQLVQAKLPIMVWIHGGANTLGSARYTQGYHLAGTQNVIVVSLEYRLGLLGWLSHPALRNAAPAPVDASSNFGLLDQIAALQWVKNNIAAFGGDPNNVTIFGESAGGFDVFALMAAPPAKDLFQRAIAESGALRTIPQTQAENYTDDSDPGTQNSSREFINKLLIADGRAADRAQAKALQNNMSDIQLLDYLRGKPAADLFKIVEKNKGLGYLTPTNIRDGYMLPHKPLMEVFADPAQYNVVPIIIGNSHNEFKFFLWTNPNFVDMRFGFLPKLKNTDEYNRITDYFSDQWQVVGVNEPAAVLQRSQPGKVFTYRFDWADQRQIGDMDLHELFGASHNVINSFVFGFDANRTLPFMTWTQNPEARSALSAAIMNYWTTFAKTGTPGNGGNAAQPAWQPWQERGAKKMIFDIPQHGGIHMSDDIVGVADLKQRLRNDKKSQTQRSRCELYTQLFWYGLSSDFWSDAEYRALGCAQYPVSEFKGVL